MRAWITGEETEFGAFEALNRAFLSDGAVVVVDAGAAPDQPVEIIYSLGSQAAEAIHLPRTLIVAADNSHVHTGTSASFRIAQKRSKYGSAGERPKAGPGRRATMRAPSASTHSSSATARSRSSSESSLRG